MNNGGIWRWRSSPASSTGTSPVAPRPDAQLMADSLDPIESRRRRAFSRALRSLSSSSVDSASSAAPRNHGIAGRKLQKPPSGSGSVIERLHRQVSRDSSASNSASESLGSPLDVPFDSMEIIRCGWSKIDGSLLKPRSEYLVLTDHCLVKLSGPEPARAIFPQLAQLDTRLKMTPPSQPTKFRSAAAEIRFEIPLRSIVAIYSEDPSASRSSIEVWWCSQPPKLGYSRALLNFAFPRERDQWLAALQQAHKLRLRKNPTNSIVPNNIRIRINHAIQIAENPQATGTGAQQLIFPVARRAPGPAQKGTAADDSQGQIVGSSFFLVVGPCLCYLIQVLSADYSSLPGDLRIKSIPFGTVTMTRFQASVASYDQRFTMTFRPPFGREVRLDLASVFYRRIIETLTKVDRILKPMWPQNLQQAIFQIKGLPPPLHLTSGNDLGGLEMSLQAYCAAYSVPVPSWTIEWPTPSQPAFRLLPSDGPEYTPLQLLAVFRSLRYNSFFKAISFRDVSLSSLAGKKDFSQYGDCVVSISLSGLSIPEEHHKILLESTVLEQEIHALMFASESIRSVDFTRQQSILGQGNAARTKQISSELMSPIMMLLRRKLCHCHSISVSGNVLSISDVDELANVLNFHGISIKKLELARCGLADGGLTKLWSALAGQAETLEWLDTSENQGIVRFSVIRETLSRFRRLKILNIAGNTRVDGEASLFVQDKINSWPLQELDLSGIMLNDATVDVIAGYLSSDSSQNLQVLRLNSSRLTGGQIARLFRSMGQARRLTLHMNANRLDEGIDDLCAAIRSGAGPWSLFVSMTEFYQEVSYVKFLRALTVNKTIECLSLAGTATSDALSSAACQAVSDFFANNDTVRFLDISGYVSKLDEGRLGREFSKALNGLRANKRIGHLRVRDQMLNINIGDLAEAISDNKTLHTVDCEGNDFNLSNFWHLVKHIERNETIRYFSAFSDQELAHIYQGPANSADPVSSFRRPAVMAKRKHDKSPSGGEKPLVQRLQDEWDHAIDALTQVLERNRKLHQRGRQSMETEPALANQQTIHIQEPQQQQQQQQASSAPRDLASEVVKAPQSPSETLQDCLTLLSKASLRDLEGADEKSLEVMLQCNSAVSSNLSGAESEGPPPPPVVSVPVPLPLPVIDVLGQKHSADWSEVMQAQAFDDDTRGDAYCFLGDGDEDNAVLQMGSYGRMLCKLASHIEEEDDRAEAERMAV